VESLLRQPADPEKAGVQAARLVALMTPEERFGLVSGGNSFGVSGVPRLGIPPLQFANASAGIRIVKQLAEIYKQTTAFPSTILLASTWDAGLAHEYARALGEEMRAGGVHVLLGPGANIYRVSTCGRNFEYFGEDPLLASSMVEDYVRGLQSMGVAATLKHFIGNETEHYRRTSNSIIDERALNEIYLPPFRAGVEAGAWAVMTSYNQLNGEWTGQSADVINGLLRGRLGFKWLCMTDWTSTWDGMKLAASGQDLEKPSGFALKREREKLLGSTHIDRMAASILKTGIAAGFYAKDFRKPEWMANWAAREAVAKKVNERGIVLLQNNGILPLAADHAANGTILIAGTNATRMELSGRGSGHVKGFNNKTYTQAVAETLPGEIVVEKSPTDGQIRSARLILLFPGYPLTGSPAEAEASDRPFAMPDDDLIRKCTGLNPNTVVCVTAGAGVAMDWAPSAAAILQSYYRLV
jgi:beta-glucosidase